MEVIHALEWKKQQRKAKLNHGGGSKKAGHDFCGGAADLKNN